MSTRILAISHPKDLHCHAVADAVQEKGGTMTIWYTSDFPVILRESVQFVDGQKHIYMKGPETNIHLEANGFDVIWHRRPSYYTGTNDQISPLEQEYFKNTCRRFQLSLIRCLPRDAFWINPPGSELSCNKITQQRVAHSVGFKVPPTLYSNNPENIRSFIRRHGGVIAYKTIAPMASWKDSDRAWVLHTALIQESDLIEDELLCLTPSIYQAAIPKAFEIRLTMIGKHPFAAKIHSQSTEQGKNDWRRASDEILMEPFSMPDELVSLCRVLMMRLRIVFGAFDFIVTPSGDIVFLEVNQMGQFLFVEKKTGQEMLDSFAEMLIQSRWDYKKSSSRKKISRYSESLTRIQHRLREAMDAHVDVSPSAGWDERGN